MSHKNENWFGWFLLTIEFSGAGFAAGLHRFVWGLFWLLSIIWVIFWWFGGGNKAYDEFLWWLIALGAPLVAGIALRFVQGIVFSMLLGQSAIANSSANSSPKNGKTDG